MYPWCGFQIEGGFLVFFENEFLSRFWKFNFRDQLLSQFKNYNLKIKDSEVKLNSSKPQKLQKHQNHTLTKHGVV